MDWDELLSAVCGRPLCCTVHTSQAVGMVRSAASGASRLLRWPLDRPFLVRSWCRGALLALGCRTGMVAVVAALAATNLHLADMATHPYQSTSSSTPAGMSRTALRSWNRGASCARSRAVGGVNAAATWTTSTRQTRHGVRSIITAPSRQARVISKANRPHPTLHQQPPPHEQNNESRSREGITPSDLRYLLWRSWESNPGPFADVDDC
ncbi:hypothetical protein B0T18DRAFT_51909 [Schizothecium vesticola]|uniref:Uncharacterized protein n=1 Tax=Schizothecium vesticola TaxID=314040 RepID=A0AA40FC39_9PEZI|nr:hypothetical protein B0T18DRAFT_51909 [Schizothecium vesticola]